MKEEIAHQAAKMKGEMAAEMLEKIDPAAADLALETGLKTAQVKASGALFLGTICPITTKELRERRAALAQEA